MAISDPSSDAAITIAIINNVGVIVSSSAWPLAFVAVAYILRREASGFIARLRRVKWGEFEASVDVVIQEKLASPPDHVEESVSPPVASDEISRLSPIELIVTSWLKVERALEAYAAEHDPDWLNKRVGAIPRRLLDVLSFNDKHLIRELKNIRNRVVHEGEVPMSEESLELYAERAAQAVRLIEDRRESRSAS